MFSYARHETSVMLTAKTLPNSLVHVQRLVFAYNPNVSQSTTW